MTLQFTKKSLANCYIIALFLILEEIRAVGRKLAAIEMF